MATLFGISLYVIVPPIYNHIREQYDKTKDDDGTLKDPIILDLDGDGIETTAIDDVDTCFDHDKNGFAELTTWAAEDDGVLAIDKNGNGTIDDGNEIFGDNYELSGGGTAADGFEALADLDTNSDGKIDSSDNDFSDLRIVKGDGTILTMAQAGIQSLNLTHTDTGTVDGNGNTQVSLGSYTKTDQSTHDMGDYLLQVNPMLSVQTEELTVPPNIEALPDAYYGGNVYTLHQAMVRDTSGSLKTLIQNYVAETDVASREAMLNNIIFEWTGTDGINPTSRGLNIDARELASIEKLMADDFYSTYDQSANPNLEASNYLKQVFRNIKDFVNAQLLSQSHYSDLSDLATPVYDVNDNLIGFDLSPVITELEDRIAIDAVAGKEDVVEFAKIIKGLGLATISNLQGYADNFAGLYPELGWQIDKINKKVVNGTTGNDNIETAAQDDAIWLDAGDDIASGKRGDDVIYGGAGNDTIAGCSGEDLLYGEGDNDLIYGNYGSDTIKGGAGNDSMEGDVDNDLLYGGDGADYIEGNEGDDTIYGDDGNDTIKGEGHRDDDTLYGDVAYEGQGKDIVYGGLGDDSIDGYGGDDTLYGNEGNDTLIGNIEDDILYGNEGNDSINGGSGLDSLYGGVGDDIYVVNDNSDDVIIENLDEGTDTVQAGVSVTLLNNVENLTLTGTSAIDGTGNALANVITGNSRINVIDGAAGNDTISDILGGNDTIFGGLGDDQINVGNDSILGYYGDKVVNGDDGNDTITAVSYDANTLNGGAGNDSIISDYGFAVMNGGTGNDTFTVTNSGSNTYEFSLGDGQDVISDTAGAGDGYTDIIEFGAGIAENDLTYNKNGSDLVIGIDGTSDQITVQDWYSYSGLYVDTTKQLEQIKLSDQTILDLRQTAFELKLDEIELNESIDFLSLSPTQALYNTWYNNVVDNFAAWNTDGNSNTLSYDEYKTVITPTFGANADDFAYKAFNQYDANQDDYFSFNEFTYIYTKFDTNKNGVWETAENSNYINTTAYAPINGTSGNDSLEGTVWSEDINGLAGNDTINSGVQDVAVYYGEKVIDGGDGNDSIYANVYLANSYATTISGGAGDDYIETDYGFINVDGGTGNDTIVADNSGGFNYNFSLGDGVDVIRDTAAGTDHPSYVDTVKFASGITDSDVAIYQDGNDLVLGYGSTDKITVEDNFVVYKNMEYLQLNNGEYLSHADLVQVLQDITAYATANSITLTSVEDVKNNTELMNIIAAAWHS